MPSNYDQVLKRYFSNTDSNIFVLQNLPEVIKGTLFSRYSRSAKPLRQLFLDDFYQGEVSELFQNSPDQAEQVDIQKAEDFYERVLVGYGDDSVAELGGVHIAIENTSNIVVKVLEDARLGISPLEKSSRYVFYDQKQEGKYNYYRGPELQALAWYSQYCAVMDQLFDSYSQIVRELYESLVNEAKPADVPEVAFKASCRGKACDIARYLLPMGTLTNVGLFGNGRAFEYLLIKLRSLPFAEAHQVADQMQQELRKAIPAFVKRVGNERGVSYVEYLESLRQQTEAVAGRLDPVTEQPLHVASNVVKLVGKERNALTKVLTALLYPVSNISWQDLERQVKQMTKEEQAQILAKLTSLRQNRHHKLARGFEQVSYTFEVESDIGAFRDLQRHRVLTQQRQPYSTLNGYTLPLEIIAIPHLHQVYVQALTAADQLYREVYHDYPALAQYVVPFAFRLRYYFHLNLREAAHLTELRSISQGHPSYRKIAQQIAQQIKKHDPLLGKYALGFVDYQDYKLERLAAFTKVAESANKLGVTAFRD